MIKANMTPHQFRVTFKDSGIERTQYTDDRRYYERLIAEHGHLSDLSIQPLTLTAEQQTRLDEIAAKGFEAHDAALYVQYGTTESEDTGYFYADKLASYQRDRVEPAVRKQRKDAESRGVVVNGVSYAGDTGNRQALSEALMAADDSQTLTFAAWKDSAGNYITDHPVDDVRVAFRKIGARRSELIALEGQYVGQVADGEMDIFELSWVTQYD